MIEKRKIVWQTNTPTISIPRAAWPTLGIEEGKDMDLIFDINTKTILIRGGENGTK